MGNTMSGRAQRFHLFIKHKETQRIHRMDMEFSNSQDQEKFIQDLPETLQFLKCERMAKGY